MIKTTSTKTGPAPGTANHCKSSFALTFAVEVLGVDVWHDCNEGWLDLGPCSQGMKIQYQLYPGQNYELDILIWPHAAKIWCGLQCGWVRTWQYLQRRWFAFTIQHVFPVRVKEFQTHIATVNIVIGIGSLGANAKNDKNTEVFLPPLQFGERRYFAPVVEAEETLSDFFYRLIWDSVVHYIPATHLDGLYEVPFPVKDIRHQDALITLVQESTLKSTNPSETDVEETEPEETKLKNRRESKIMKEKNLEKKKASETTKSKFEINLLGDEILSGTGRITPFNIVGERPQDQGEVIVLIGSNNLPAQDDLPILFVNVDTLFGIPLLELKKYKVSQLYTRWTIHEETHISEPQDVKSKTEIKFKDHHAFILEQMSPAQIIATFLDLPFEIQLRGICQPHLNETPKLFGSLKTDQDITKALVSKPLNLNADILIAVTKINGCSIAKGINDLLRGEYPLYPPTSSIVNVGRREFCTNDTNGIRLLVKPELVVPSYKILEAQMTLEVSIGLVGCRPKKLEPSFSRLFILIKDDEKAMLMLHHIIDTTEENKLSGPHEDLLTGFAIDAGDVVVFFIEGPTGGEIQKVWKLTENYYPDVKPLFSSCDRFTTRIYPEMLVSITPFCLLKMQISLGVILTCPSIYARPALPLPTRSAVLKIGRLVAGKFHSVPCRSEMPSMSELNSFKLELCVPPRTDK